MPNFVELWVYLSSEPLFGLTSTITVYILAHSVYVRLGQAPLANPVLWSVIVLGAGLMITRVPYPTYFAGAQFIHFLLGPAVVALGFPLWERRDELRRGWGRYVVAALAGGATAAIVAVVLGWALGLPDDVLRSLAPKSVTAPVAMGIAEKIGGVPALAAVFAVLTGLVGALSGSFLFRLLGIGTKDADWVARGFSLGTASHGIGAARALQVNADAGAFAGLALSLQVLLAALLMPLIAQWF
ncbi:LrgB family protein [Paenalcaligenes suwonensis]|uniref:LrgB family protein n=1 Tax=Paenalcaligenes suwonensis TaxID=1202713 RepID=UPI001409CE54|nr:LrgB family protein [Paenalcaligenes suwonensis]NHC62992.1 LrgB family protein [Paenalcaligenes suwonensis]